MALAAKTTGQRNLCETGAFASEKIFRTLYTALQQILVRRNTQGLLEHSYEMVGAELCNTGQLAEG